MNAPCAGQLPLVWLASILAYGPCTGKAPLRVLCFGFGPPAEVGASSLGLGLPLFGFLFLGEHALIDAVSAIGVGPFSCGARWVGLV